MSSSPCYIFIDEGGNFDFSANGTRYFSLTCMATREPTAAAMDILNYRYELLSGPRDQDVEYFHCAHDNRFVRERFFEIIAAHQTAFRFDTLIIDKRKTPPEIQAQDRFYPEMLGRLLGYVLSNLECVHDRFILVTDRIPINSKRQAVEKAIKLTLAAQLPDDVPYKLYHHESRAHTGLQIADYANWALLRKYEKGEVTYYDLIKPRLESEYAIYDGGQILYY